MTTVTRCKGEITLIVLAILAVVACLVPELQGNACTTGLCEILKPKS
jgi:hypothetical protein